MKRALISLLERLRTDLNEAISALEHDDVAGAIGHIDGIVDRIAAWTKEHRS